MSDSNARPMVSKTTTLSNWANEAKGYLLKKTCHQAGFSGAGEGNRTLTTSLEGWNSTIELHPQVERKTRFELATFTLARWRSTTEPLPQKEFLVQMKGVEPPRLSALDPKSSASANFATSALLLFLMAGIAGFEPTNARVKVWCLTTWRYPTR